MENTAYEWLKGQGAVLGLKGLRGLGLPSLAAAATLGRRHF